MTVSTNAAEAQNTRTLALSCPATLSGQDVDALCETMQSALQEALPGHDIRTGAGQTAPGVTLTVTAASARAMTAQLDWALPGKAPQSTDILNLSVSDGQPRKSAYRPFAQHLVKMSAPMIKALTGQ